jgi:hypothetical protein
MKGRLNDVPSLCNQLRRTSSTRSSENTPSTHSADASGTIAPRSELRGHARWSTAPRLGRAGAIMTRPFGISTNTASMTLCPSATRMARPFLLAATLYGGLGLLPSCSVVRASGRSRSPRRRLPRAYPWRTAPGRQGRGCRPAPKRRIAPSSRRGRGRGVSCRLPVLVFATHLAPPEKRPMAGRGPYLSGGGLLPSSSGLAGSP